MKERNTYKQGSIPTNSRVFVEYHKDKKPTIKFQYPSKDTSTIKYSLPTIIPSAVIVLIFMAVTLSYVISLPEPKITITNATIIYSTYNITYDSYITVNYTTADKKEHTTIISYESQTSLEKLFGTGRFTSPANDSIVYTFKVVLVAFGWIASLVLLFNFLMSLFGKIFSHTKWGNKKYPVLNAKLHDSKFTVEFKKLPPEGYIEIPLFRNIYLNYHATKQFSEYLHRVEIVEHPFSSITKKKGKPIKKKNIWLWRARFYFTQTPKDGKINIGWT